MIEKIKFKLEGKCQSDNNGRYSPLGERQTLVKHEKNTISTYFSMTKNFFHWEKIQFIDVIWPMLKNSFSSIYQREINKKVIEFFVISIYSVEDLFIFDLFIWDW